MTPAQTASRALRVLAAELDEVLQKLTDLALEISDRDPGEDTNPDRALLALLALDLHSYYTMLEALLERIAGAIDGVSPTGPASHTALVHQMSRPIEGVRPVILAPERLTDLDELRRFRHALRHVYTLELHETKLRRVLAPFALLHAGIAADLVSFRSFLARTATELDEHTG